MLPHVLRWNADKIEDRLVDIHKRLFKESNTPFEGSQTEQLIQRVERLMTQLNMPKRLRDLDIDDKDLESVARKAAADFSMAANPRLINSFEDPLEVLREAY